MSFKEKMIFSFLSLINFSLLTTFHFKSILGFKLSSTKQEDERGREGVREAESQSQKSTIPLLGE